MAPSSSEVGSGKADGIEVDDVPGPLEARLGPAATGCFSRSIARIAR